MTRTSVSLANFRAFLARKDTRGWVRSIVVAKIPSLSVEDVMHDALTEAITAFENAPPSKDEVLTVWLATITRRTVADFLKKRGRRSKYEGAMPTNPDTPSLDSAYDTKSTFGDDDESEESVAGPSYDPREGSVDDLELNGSFLFRWLERQVADNPIERDTFELVLEHGLGKKTYQMLADERGISLTVLSSRIFEFRKKYIPRYKRERNRTLLIVLLFGFGVAMVALAIWLLQRAAASPHDGLFPPAPSPVLERVFGRDIPVSHPPPDNALEPDAGTNAPRP